MRVRKIESTEQRYLLLNEAEKTALRDASEVVERVRERLIQEDALRTGSYLESLLAEVGLIRHLPGYLEDHRWVSREGETEDRSLPRRPPETDGETSEASRGTPGGVGDSPLRSAVLDVLEAARRVAFAFREGAPLSAHLEDLRQRVGVLNRKPYPREPELSVLAAMKSARKQLIEAVEGSKSVKEALFRLRVTRLDPPEEKR